MTSYQAYQISNPNGTITGTLVEKQLEPLEAGQVRIDADYSSINFKDALAATGKGSILKRFPLVGGVDVAGTIVSSKDSDFQTGDRVLVTGCGLGESHDGGYSQCVTAPSHWVIKLPEGLSTRDAMIFGTAGFTAALCLYRFDCNAQIPEQGPILVTGASGGVGLFSVSMLTRRGFEVIAMSGKEAVYPMLESLGAKKIISPGSLPAPERPLDKAIYGGAIDNVGGNIMSQLIPKIKLWGNIASVGVAGGVHYQSTVLPHCLRGVSILGISSTNCPMKIRTKLWQQLSSELAPEDLEQFVTQEVSMKEIGPACHEMIARKTHGRMLVNCKAQMPSVSY